MEQHPAVHAYVVQEDGAAPQSLAIEQSRVEHVPELLAVDDADVVLVVEVLAELDVDVDVLEALVLDDVEEPAPLDADEEVAVPDDGPEPLDVLSGASR